MEVAGICDDNAPAQMHLATGMARYMGESGVGVEWEGHAVTYSRATAYDDGKTVRARGVERKRRGGRES